MIFYSTPGLSSFVQKDIEILKKLGTVHCFVFDAKKKIRTPVVCWYQLRQIIRHLSEIRLFVCQFAGYHSLIPVLLGRLFHIPSIIIVGGVDAVAYPSFKYGYFQQKLIRPFVKWTYRLANVIAAKDDSLFWFHDLYYGKDSAYQGIDVFMPDLKAEKVVIYNGYEASKWEFRGEKNPTHFITVAGNWEKGNTAMLKGIDLIFQIAERFGQCTFEIIGGGASYQKPVPDNVVITPYIPNDQLVNTIGKATFYLQLSISEGFPNALCEAMLCRCIPIVSNVAAMPNIVGETGFILKQRDVRALSHLIEDALSLDAPLRRTMGESARNRIVHHFPLQRRADELIALAARWMI